MYFRPLRIIPIQIFAVPAMMIMAGPAFATVYLNVAEVQEAIFPGAKFMQIPLSLSEEQQRSINETSSLQGYFKEQQVWSTDQGGFLVIDQVIGKHEKITFAVGINTDGSIRQVEIMEYREAHGSEIRQKKWRKQFIGKTNASDLRLNGDIKNISGATLSCRHVTEGVKRILSLYELVLKK